jgi:hypothetical protein
LAAPAGASGSSLNYAPPEAVLEPENSRAVLNQRMLAFSTEADMRRALIIGLVFGGLAGCVSPVPPPPPPPRFAVPPPRSAPPPQPGAAAPVNDLRSARLACNTTYPPKIGNYLPHAQCVNQAVEQYALPAARYPDLVELQEQLRAKFSSQIDNGTLTPQAGEQQMLEADNLVTAAEHDRDSGQAANADQRIVRLQAMLR